MVVYLNKNIVGYVIHYSWSSLLTKALLEIFDGDKQRFTDWWNKKKTNAATPPRRGGGSLRFDSIISGGLLHRNYSAYKKFEGGEEK